MRPLTLALALPLLVVLARAETAQTPRAAQDTESRARAIVAALVAGDFGKIESQYDEQLARALPPGTLASSWATSASQLGPFDAIEGVQVQTVGTNQVALAKCTFQHYSLTLRMVFNDNGQLASLASLSPSPRGTWTPPDYGDPTTFEERSVTVTTGHFELPGVLTLPKTNGPHPAVVLVHGSGPNDMDETFGPNKVFKDLAWGLATRGIAVLRYEKRSHKYGAQSADDPTELTVKEEAMDDAHSAVVLLTTMPEIDPRRIFLVGHSLGAYLAPRIASGTPQIAGIILFAANARPIEDLVVEQVRYEASLAGTVTPAIQKAIDGAEASAKEMRNPDLKKGTTVHLLNASLPASYVLDLRTYHPTDVAAALSIPILVLQGERDYQVTMTDFGLWQKALAGHPKTTLKSYPGLNHFFIMGTGPASPVEYTTPGHVDKAVVDEVATWCKGQGT